MKRIVTAPLMATACDKCHRRRVCFSILWGWFCKECIRRIGKRAADAMTAFREQGR